ncbi:MAG TPA: YraN family protein [Puia sp.]|jgi:putative endonuclease
MSQHIDLGKKGETWAAGWLLEKGFEILHRNWRYGRYEVDIIARRGDILHFIEIKSRRSDVYGHPEEGVTPKKIRNMMQAALGWRLRFPGQGHTRVQYDVLAITAPKDAKPEYFLIEDVYV